MVKLRLSPREMELLIESYRRVKKDFNIVVNNCYVELENDIEFLEEIIDTILAFFLSKGLK